MIRLSLLALFITFISLYAFRDWYKSLCALILMIGIIEHPDMPKSIAGIQGLNPWNITLIFVLLGWLKARKVETMQWDMSKHITFLLIFFIITIAYSFYHMTQDMSGLQSWAAYKGAPPYNPKSMANEYIINAYKWLVPAFLLYIGCNSAERLRWATAAILGIYILLAIQVIKWMPLSNLAGGEELSERALKILVDEVGFHRVNLSMLLAGGAWAVVAARVLVKPSLAKWFFLVSAMVFFAQALTGGRMGYVTWTVVGAVLASIKWRRYLVLAPILLIAVVMFVPGVWERMTQGFDEDTFEDDTTLEASEYYEPPDGGISWYTVTSGRSIAWPYIIEKIKEQPWTGYGRLAMPNTGLTEYLWSTMMESFPHPHNLYLEFILENGFIGFIPVLFMFLIFVRRSLSLFREKNCMDCVGAGGVAFSLIGAFMFAGLGSQTFYPREGAVGMWAAIALMLRVYQQREYLIQAGKWEKGVSKGEDLWKVGPAAGKKKRGLYGNH